jgi:hypothetical protein
MPTIDVLLDNPRAIAFGLYVVTLFGTVATYVFGLQKGFEGSVAFLRRIAPDRSDVFYSRVDFLIVTFVGSLIGLIIFAPRNAFQALAAGCGWVGALNVLLSARPPHTP